MNDFSSAIDDLHQFLRQDRHLEDIQKVMILKRKVDLVRNHLNQLLNVYSGDLSRRSEVIAASINKLQEILNKMPNHDGYEISWLNISTFRTILISAMAVTQGTNSISKVHAQANLLSHLLMEVPRITSFPPASKEDWNKELFELRRTYFNAIQITAGLFNTAVLGTYLVEEKKMISWVNEAFWHFKMLIDYHKTIDYNFLWQQNSSDVNEFYRKAYSTMLALSYIPAFLVVIYQIWGEDWPQTVMSYGMVENTTAEGICTAIFEGLSYYNNRRIEVENLFSQGKLDRNANPTEFRGYSLIMNTEHNIKRLLVTVEALSNLKTDQAEEMLQIAVDETRDVLRELVVLGGEDTFASSTFGQAYASVVPLYLAMTSRLSVMRNDITTFETSMRTIEVFLDQTTEEDYPLVTYSVLLTKLYLQTHVNYSLDEIWIGKMINDVREAMDYSPRMLLSLSHLQFLLQNQGNNLTEKAITSHIKHLRKLATEYSFPHLSTELTRIQKELLSENTEYGENYLDIHCWLNPKFNLNIDGVNRVIPFRSLYLQKYRIVPESA